MKSSIKTTITIWNLAVWLLFCHGCDVLDQDPRNEVTESIAIADIQGANAVVAGLYNQLQDGNYYGRNFLVMSDVSTDQAQSIGTWDFYREMDTYQNSTGNTEIGNFYSRAYRAIYVANTVITSLGSIPELSETVRSNMLGEAHFVRALAYFDITRVFGGYPNVVGTLGAAVVLENERGNITYPARVPIADSYDLVETELLQALDLLSESSDRSRASKGAARALLSRLYLYTENFTAAADYATQVIEDQGRYALNPSYLDIFATKLSSESIFELNFNNADQSGIRNWYFPTSQGGRGDLAAHDSFVEKAREDPDDVRGTLFGVEPSSGVYYPTKYQKAGNIDNIHVLRIAEMYLNRAEAKVRAGIDLEGALEDLNLVRTRSGAQPITVTGSTALLEAIWREQQLEFAFEGHSLFDLARTGQLGVVVNNTPRLNSPNIISFTDINRAVFPIPLFELNSNENMVQNEAYR